MEYALALLVLAALVALAVGPPLRRRGEEEARELIRLEELEAAKEAKYREIRDAEIDHRMGKLSEADWRRVDGDLRAEALEILRELDAAGGALRTPRARDPHQLAGQEPVVAGAVDAADEQAVAAWRQRHAESHDPARAAGAGGELGGLPAGAVAAARARGHCRFAASHQLQPPPGRRRNAT